MRSFQMISGTIRCPEMPSMPALWRMASICGDLPASPLHPSQSSRAIAWRARPSTILQASALARSSAQRLLIEKVSGRVLYVDITFVGFLGLGAHHHTIPWEKLDYDTRLGGYRTDITAEQVKGAPAFYSDDGIWPDRKREQQLQDHWRYPYIP